VVAPKIWPLLSTFLEVSNAFVRKESGSGCCHVALPFLIDEDEAIFLNKCLHPKILNNFIQSKQHWKLQTILYNKIQNPKSIVKNKKLHHKEDTV